MSEAAPDANYSTWKDGNPATIVLGWHLQPPDGGRWAGWFVVENRLRPRLNGSRAYVSCYLLDVKPETRIAWNRALCGRGSICYGKPQPPQAPAEVEWPCPDCLGLLEARRRARDGALEVLV
jgi:hypothetical protein